VTTRKRDDGEAGTRLDILVEAVTEDEAAAGDGNRAAVVVEMNDCWNREAKQGSGTRLLSDSPGSTT